MSQPTPSNNFTLSAKPTLDDWTRAWPQLKKVGDEYKGPCPNRDCDADDDGFWVKMDGTYGCRKCRPGSANTDACIAILEGAGLYQQGRAESEVTIALNKSAPSRPTEKVPDEPDHAVDEYWSKAALPVDGTPAEAYLINRKILPEGVQFMGSIGWIKRDDYKYNNLPQNAAGCIAYRSINEHGVACCVEFDALTQDGDRSNKIDGGERFRRTHGKKAGCVWASTDGDAKADLHVIAEGTLNAVAAATLTSREKEHQNDKIVAISTGGTSGVNSIPKRWLATNTEFWVDGDEAGDKAAHTIFKRCKELGCAIPVFRQCPEGKDAADVLCDKLDFPAALSNECFEEVENAESTDKTKGRGFADRFADEYRDKHIYTAQKGWLYFVDGYLWRQDVEQLHLRMRLHETIEATWKKSGGKSKPAVGPMIYRLAPLMMYVDDDGNIGRWDDDFYIHGLPSGWIQNLETGERRKAEPKDRVTMQAGAVPAEGPMPDVEKVLDNALIRREGNEAAYLEERTYLLKLLASGLIGKVYDVFQLLIGEGGGGKTTLLELWYRACGDYGIVIDGNNLLGRTNRHPEWIARMRGKRAGIVNDLPSGSWDTGTLKAMVTGDTMTAAMKHQDSFDFSAMATLFFAGNVKPNMRHVDSGLTRRMATNDCRAIDEDKQDKNLRTKLDSQLPQFLHALVIAAGDLIRDGLGKMPLRWSDATRDYAAEEDVVRAWFESECELDPRAWTPGCVYRDSFKEFTGLRTSTRPADIYKRLRTITGLELLPSQKEWNSGDVSHRKRGVVGIRINSEGQNYHLDNLPLISELELELQTSQDQPVEQVETAVIDDVAITPQPAVIVPQPIEKTEPTDEHAAAIAKNEKRKAEALAEGKTGSQAIADRLTREAKLKQK